MLHKNKCYLWVAGLVILSFQLQGCSTSQISIEGPYFPNALTKEELIIFAKNKCKRHDIPNNLPRPFTTDGCSHYPDGSIGGDNEWRECCLIHDMEYWCGGTRDERRKSDENLKQCVAKKGFPEQGKIMRWGTTIGGSPAYPFPWRWGYGWPWGHGYDEPEVTPQQ